MTYCSKKDLCYNYPLKCDSCISFSDCMNDTPLFQDKDLVEVVRCKDCKFWTPMDDGISWKNKGRTDGECEMLLKRHYSARIWTKQDHFCSYGERKE